MIVQRSRTSFWFYTFCCLASFTAFGWYEVTRPTAGAGEYASSAEEQVIKKLQTVNKSLTGSGTKGDKNPEDAEESPPANWTNSA